MATNYTIDKSHTHVTFSISHFMIAKVRGSFKEFSGTVVTPDDDMEGAQLALSIEAGSLDTNDVTRDGHLKTADFFNTVEFPLITYKSSKFVKRSGKDFDVEGVLNVNGIEKELPVKASFDGTFEHPVSKHTIAVFNVTADIPRKDFGIGLNYPSAVLGDVVKLESTVELIKE